MPLFTDELFDPEVNVRFGAAYLGALLKRFGGQIALAAGAYNAGSHAMMRWCDQWGSRPLDEFVELVTYDQAREYIKRVLAVYAHYRLALRRALRAVACGQSSLHGKTASTTDRSSVDPATALEKECEK